MSDQTEKPDGALPKGYDANTPSTENTSSTEIVRRKKINFKKLFSVTPTDQDQREKDLQEYESSYIARIEKNTGPKPEESSDSFLVDLAEDEGPQEDLGKLNLSKHAVNKRKKLQEERAEYEQRYLSKYKEPKGKPRKKGLSKLYKPETKVKVDRKKVRREYERKFLTRFKKEKTKSSKTGASSLYKPEPPKPKRDMKKERAEYEKKFLARYKEPKSKSNKPSSSKYDDDLGRLDIRKHSVVKRKAYLAERAAYEKKFLAHYDITKEKENKIDAAIIIGGEPATVFSAIAPVPEGLDKYLFAGITRKKGIKTVKCKTVDLEVPANAEMVLEGYVDSTDIRSEGPFGDHTGFYTPQEPFPTFTLTGIMQRKNPIYLTTVVGKPILEDAYIGKVIERSFLPLIRMLHPEVVDFSMPPAGWFQGLAIVSIKKRYPGQAKKVMMGLWGMGQLSLTKMIIVVDHDVNVHNINDVIWAVTTKTDAARDITIIDNAPTDTLDPASPRVNLGSKLGVDATQKTKEEGFEREIQEEVKIDDDTKKMVDSKWSSYGL